MIKKEKGYLLFFLLLKSERIFDKLIQLKDVLCMSKSSYVDLRLLRDVQLRYL